MDIYTYVFLGEVDEPNGPSSEDLVVLCPEEFNQSSKWYQFAEKLQNHTEKLFWIGDGNEKVADFLNRANEVRTLRSVFRSRNMATKDKLSVAGWILFLMNVNIPDVNSLENIDVWLLK